MGLAESCAGRPISTSKVKNSPCSSRLQNDPYFCVFKYARLVKQTVRNEAENKERDLGRDAKNTDCPFCIFFSLASHAPRACEARALRARKTLTARFTDFFTDFEKKNRLFWSLLLLQAGGHLSGGYYQPPSWNRKRLLTGLSHAICFLFKKTKTFFVEFQLNSKNNGPDQFCYLRQRYIVTTDGKDGHGLKLEKVGPTFSSFNSMPAKKKIFTIFCMDYSAFHKHANCEVQKPTDDCVFRCLQSS